MCTYNYNSTISVGSSSRQERTYLAHVVTCYILISRYSKRGGSQTRLPPRGNLDDTLRIPRRTTRKAKEIDVNRSKV